MARKRTSENDLVVSSGSAAAAPRRKASTARTKHSVAPPAEVSIPTVYQSKAPTAPAPSHEQVAKLAFSYWAERGYRGGSPEGDWLRAEKELRTAAGIV